MKNLLPHKVLFSLVLLAMLAVTAWASLKVPLWDTGPSLKDPWMVATLFDAYFGFLTFFCWVVYKERRLLPRVLWFVLVMTLGNIAMAVYVLREAFRLGKDGTVFDLLTRQNA